ncbi:hypothetical protein IVB22_10735 [Bradyrhizobium sp. 190]|uniref:hypothetical protein n=1 Tax=Bradyrhizobium sp. 190 TaxID=2782658 RepID=UPI001FF703ED|nr:hypothetical protein [Bradyrhizobium sp. 190]MCK1513040.1 hypothetical protein [Bradyrhizobium sp. 190]
MAGGRQLFESFRTKVLGQLSQAERMDVEKAVKVLRGYLDGKKAKDEHSKEVDNHLAELESGDSKRQRKILAKPEFRSRLANEVQRVERINALHFFKTSSSGSPFSYKKASALAFETHRFYVQSGIANDNAEGERLRSVHFGALKTDIERWEAVQFCIVFAYALAFLPAANNSDLISDETLRKRILNECVKRLSSITDDTLLNASIARLENIPNDIEPVAIMHYADVFRQTGWSQPITAGRLAADVEAKRVAAEKRRQVETQLTFTVKDETLDISMYGWPRLVDAADKVTLFENLRAAFARAMKLRFAYNPDFGRGLLAERGIRSMSVRQLACVKNLIWADRVGLQFEFKELGDLSRSCAQAMLELLNADGHAFIQIRDGKTYDFEPLDAELAAKWRADLDDAWLQHADTFQKWIESDTFAGELTRWIVEDPGDSAGWATSR